MHRICRIFDRYIGRDPVHPVRFFFSLGAFIVFLFAACSVPNLETPDCTESRNIVRELYSFHFGNDMHPSEENIELRSKFLTDSFKKEVLKYYQMGRGVKEGDEFTKTLNDPPKAFRVGECKVIESDKKTEVEVLLFWKDDRRSDQRTLKVETVKADGKWLVNNITLLP